MPPIESYFKANPSKFTFTQSCFRKFLIFLFRSLTRLSVEGLDNIPQSGPMIVAINHLHWIDIPLGIAVIPRRVVILSKRKWQRRIFARWFLNLMGSAIYADNSNNLAVLRQAMTVLQFNGALGIAPEGTRSKTGGLGKGEIGVAYLASSTSAPVLPMVMYGQEKTGYYLSRFTRVPIYVRIAAPIILPPGTETNHSSLEAQTKAIMIMLARMLPPEYRGLYSDLTESR